MEHLHHFDLRQDPFQIEPDLRCYFDSPSHREAQCRVERGLRQMKGLTVMTGEGGTGKTLLARRILNALEEEVFEASLMVMLPGAAEAGPVLHRFARQLGVDHPADDRAALMVQIYEMLAAVREEGRHSVLILDDAHLLGAEPMAEIGGLLNLEYEDRRLLSILLVGLPVLDDSVLVDAALQARVDVRVRLQPLDFENAAAYLQHRLLAAGGRPEIVSPAAVSSLFRLASGRPRLMNTLADNALFEAFLGKRAQIDESDVERAAADLGIAVDASKATAVHPPAAHATSPVVQAASSQAPPSQPPAAVDAAAAFEAATVEQPTPPAPAQQPTPPAPATAQQPTPPAPATAQQPTPPAPAPTEAAPVPVTGQAFDLDGPELFDAPAFDLGEGVDASAPRQDARGQATPELAGSNFAHADLGAPELELEVGDELETSLLEDSVEEFGTLLDAQGGGQDEFSTLLVSPEDENGTSSTIDLENEIGAGVGGQPTFAARNSGAPVMAEATQIAMPDDGPPKDSSIDELDDLFVELIED